MREEREKGKLDLAEGLGFPAGYDSTTSRPLGTRLVNALSKQLGGELTLRTSPLGTNITLLIPLGLATTK